MVRIGLDTALVYLSCLDPDRTMYTAEDIRWAVEKLHDNIPYSYIDLSWQHWENLRCDYPYLFNVSPECLVFLQQGRTGRSVCEELSGRLPMRSVREIAKLLPEPSKEILPRYYLEVSDTDFDLLTEMLEEDQ